MSTRSLKKATAVQLASMQAACSSCEMNLTGAIKNSTNIVRESGDPSRDATFAMQGQMEHAIAVIKGQVIKCLENIEIIRVNQDQTDANAKATEDLLDRFNDSANAALEHVFKQLARYKKALRPMPPVAAVGGAPRALICKPDLALKPEEFTLDMTPVVFACWLDAFEAYYDASNMQVKELAVQQAYFKACIHPSLYGRIEALIIKGQTPILGARGACSILKNEFLVEHPLFSRRLDFFRFKQGYEQSIRGEPQSAVGRLRISSTVARGRGRSLQKRVSAASKAKTNNNLSRRL
jgi:hypothetical protein